MRFLIFTHIQNAYQSVRANRLRSTLTILGIIIGVASITTILALSAGALRIVGSQVDALGGNIAVIRSGAEMGDILQDAQSIGNIQHTASTLTSVDVAALSHIPHVAHVAPLMILGGAVSGTSDAPIGTPIVATTPQLEKVNNLAIQEGQFLDPSLSPYTAVIGPQLSIYLFGTEHSIGKTVHVKGIPFTVIGVLKRTNTPVNYNGVDFDTAVFVSLDSGRELNQGSVYIQQINVQSESVAHLSHVITDIHKTLLKTHLGQADFSVLTGDQIAQPTSRIFLSIAGMAIAIAAISLFVGGVGIMNIMLVSVIERTREIGIRKALGATSGDIVGQFLIEAIVMSIGGGIGGYIMGYLVAFALSTLLTFDPVFNWQTAAIALGTSIIVGVIFGLYPAIRAAQKDPISALRQYN